MRAAEILERSRAYLLALPEVSERLSHGAPSFFAGKKCLAMYMDNHHGVGWVAFWLAGSVDFQTAMVSRDSQVYFVPPYVGHRGWLGVRLDEGLPWEQVQHHLLEAYCAVASAKMQSKLELVGGS